MEVAGGNSIAKHEGSIAQYMGYDAYGDRWSKLTFLIRLNDEFKGGATTYFTPSTTEGVLDAQPVSPGMGDALGTLMSTVVDEQQRSGKSKQNTVHPSPVLNNSFKVNPS